MLIALIVEDDPQDLRNLNDLVVGEGWHVETARSLAESRERLAVQRPDLVLCKIGLPDDCGLELLRDLENHPTIEVVLTADEPTLKTAIAAVRLGAFDYLVKPISRDEVHRVLSGITGEAPAVESRTEISESPGRPSKLADMITVSPQMRRVFERIKRVAPTDVTVLVVGESGTGKELVARAVHQLSARRDGPFLAVNCGAVSPTIIESELFGHERGSFTGADRRHLGFFERSAEGTLLLDEITEMPTELQVKLLRVLETGKVIRVGGTKTVKASPRIIAATNREPENEVESGNLREDLFYRLKVFPIRLPSLRERGPEETVFLAEHFLGELNRREGTRKALAAGAIERLQAYGWPGNVRELQNAIEASFVLAVGDIDLDHLMLDLGAGEESAAGGPKVRLEVGTTIAEAEKELIHATLDHLDGDKPEAAETLGISLKTLYNRLKAYSKRQKT